ncbi:MAG: low-specificity L-threonine aldolase [Dehalococcoidia bacterium]|nr:low-specificity L-threonine aldolase [Dehalococcoidia bacterium]
MTAVIDLRSDTVSKPTPAMRRAMAEAEVGDDVFGDDPTVNRLEQMAAERMGKEAAVFVPSGTMANLIALLVNTRPGDEVLLGDQCHIFNYEGAGSARIANVQVHALANGATGGLDPAAVESAVRGPNIHTPVDSLLCLENTHNRCGGAVLPLREMDALTAVARRHGMRVHLDGARIFNAAVALETEPARIARDCDTVSFCLSKGLGCPVGSLICGDRASMELARRHRKMLGGGMRQVGILAAAGLYALEHHVERLADDHDNARRIADGLAKLGPFAVNAPQTNIIVADIVEGTLEGWLDALKEQGVLAVPFGPQRLRMVTHINISRADAEETVRRVQRAAAARAA